jgi:hypothetical protein
MSKQNLGFLLGAIAIVLVAGAPVISVFAASAIASSLGCTLNEGDAHPCLFHGVDLGETLYDMAVVGWFALGTLPVGAIALAVPAVRLDHRHDPGPAVCKGWAGPAITPSSC